MWIIPSLEGIPGHKIQRGRFPGSGGAQNDDAGFFRVDTDFGHILEQNDCKWYLEAVENVPGYMASALEMKRLRNESGGTVVFQTRSVERDGTFL